MEDCSGKPRALLNRTKPLAAKLKVEGKKLTGRVLLAEDNAVGAES